MYNEVVHLKPVDLREVWPNEAYNFTPWLAEPEHLSWLGEALKIELADVKCEVNVGQFRADIVCSNTADDSVVVIENQLRESDHNHLGQLLTYAAGLEARTLIWVAESFTDEHLAVINRLNAMRDEDFRFFGVEVKTAEITDSPYGVQFNVVAKPSVSIHPRPNNANSWAEQFYAQFREDLTANNSPLRPLAQDWNEKYPSYLGFDIGRWPEVWLGAWIELNGNRIAANLHLIGQNAASLFNELTSNRVDVETQFGRKLQWKQWNSVSYQVGVYTSTTNLTDKGDSPNQFEWLRSNLEKLNEVFGPRINGGTHGNTQTEPN